MPQRQGITVKKAKDSVLDSTMKLVEDIAIDFSNELKQEAPVDRGRLRQSIQITKVRDGFKVFPSVDYAAFVQHGTDPRKVPIEHLKVWARRKLGQESAAYAVREKIAKKGTDANPFITRAIKNLEAMYK